MFIKNLKTIAILVAVLGGCTAFQSGPKHLWSARWMEYADERGWICTGSMMGAEIANPVTWFFNHPIRHYFSAKNTTQSLPGLSNEWLVRQYMAVHDERDGDIVYTMRFDVAKNKVAFIGSDSSTEEDMRKMMQNPEWKDVETTWDKNTITWIKDGMPLNANYCKKND